MTATLRSWLSEPMPADVQTAIARLCTASDVSAVAVMPDVHLGDQVCVGVVLATHRTVYPNAIGGDIGCGMAAIPLSATVDDIDNSKTAAAILQGFERHVPILNHRHKQPIPDGFDLTLLGDGLSAVAQRTVPTQLGTLGRGNHFLELQVDQAGEVWLTVHVGSRGMGQAIRDHALRHGRPCSHTGIVGLDVDSDEGRNYLHNVNWACRFADINRHHILAAAVSVLARATGATANASRMITCNHNDVARVDGRFIHRKGAIDASDGLEGIIPGSMGTSTYHVSGRGHPDALWSSSHGAGRRMSRTEARQTVHIADLQRDIAAVWYDSRKLRQLLDEAPAAYKDIDKVMRAQQQLTRIVSVLSPLLSFKGV
jgi:tRNA-splicing ligase RtcB (3'-phosphate/5'-hydroxy nucleic acid ligase)